MTVLIISLVILLSYLSNNIIVECNQATYEPTWESLDSRSLPSWYDEAKVGIFLHWGVYSVPGFGMFGSDWFWGSWRAGFGSYKTFMEKTYANRFTYQEFAKDFTAEFFNPQQWAKLFKKSGAKYVVLTSKHHDGYALWPSEYSFSWNSVDVGPHIDIVEQLSKAVQNEGLHFGLYYSLLEWFNPMYLDDQKSNFTKANFVHRKSIPEMKELIENYKPDVFWSDGEWEATNEYWQSKEFLTWLYNDSPVKETVVVNDRWGKNSTCHHGGFYTCRDRYNPGVLQEHKWENAMTIDKFSWGYRRNIQIEDMLTMEELIKTLAMTISCGGNLLINIGPTKQGTISPIFQERLYNLGDWLSINGEAIYETKPWKYQNDTISHKTWFTSKDKIVYAIVLNWPLDGILKLGAVKELFNVDNTVYLLGYVDKLKWEIEGDNVNILFPSKSGVRVQWGWVLKVS